MLLDRYRIIEGDHDCSIKLCQTFLKIAHHVRDNATVPQLKNLVEKLLKEVPESKSPVLKAAFDRYKKIEGKDGFQG